MKEFSQIIKSIRVLGTDITNPDLIEKIGDIIATQHLIDIDMENLKKIDSEYSFNPIDKNTDLIKRLRNNPRV
jgi:hypothetical protein